MNFTHISTFHAVMTSASLSDAAKKLGRTQPAVSAAIKALEDQLGLQLFERRGRKLIPVPEAQYLLTEADSILSQMSRVRQTMRSLSDGLAGTLNVAAMPGPVSMVFPKFIASMMKNTEGVSVSIQARTSKQIAELTRAQSIDFGFADAAEEDLEQTEPLYRAQFITADCVVALPAGHRLVEKQQISVDDLDGEALGMLPASHRQTRDLLARFQDRNLSYRAAIESQTFLPVLHFVAAGRCCTVMDPLSAFMVQSEDALVRGVEVRPMTEPVRYHYAIYEPRYRPNSKLAEEIKVKWRDEVMRLLEEIGTNPRLEPQPQSKSMSVSE